jgi:hypothetical protein
MIKMEEDEAENHVQKVPENQICVVSYEDSKYLEGNIKYVSIHHILCQTYNKLFKLNIHFTKSHSYANCNVLIEHFPILVYGENLVKRANVHHLLKEITKVDINFKFDKLNNELKIQSQEIEKLIFTDLQLFLGFYNYHKMRENNSRLKGFLKFLFQPILTIRTYFNDQKVLKEIYRIMSVNKKEEVTLYYLPHKNII